MVPMPETMRRRALEKRHHSWKVFAVGSAAAPTRRRRSTSASGASGRWRSSTTTRRSRPPSRARASPPGRKTIWRYADLLPASADSAVDLGAGFTPLLRADRLAAELGLSELWLKNDTVNPTGSFKDRVVSVALTRARELGFKVAACASTGNLANSVAAHAARAGMRSVVCIPADLEVPKVVTTAVFGGVLVARQRQLRRGQPAVRRTGQRVPDAGRSSTSTFAATTPKGSKTLAFEVAEQLGWKAPDHVVVPMASGSQLTKVAKGFRELFKVGLLDEEPHVRISGAQSAGCAPVASGLRVRCRLRPPREAQWHRQVAGHRQPRRRCLRPR